jgi:hypothetical protein
MWKCGNEYKKPFALLKMLISGLLCPVYNFILRSFHFGLKQRPYLRSSRMHHS